MERHIYMSPAEAAAYVGISSRQVRRWIADGRLPARRFGPRIIRIRAADLEALGRDIPTVGAQS